MPDVLIVGGGVVGLTAAWELMRAGATVTVLDRGPMGAEASWAGAGMIPPSEPHSSPGVRELAFRSATLWPNLSQSLLEATGQDNGYRRCSGWHLSFQQDPHHELTQEAAQWRECGVPAEVIAGSALRQTAPEMSPEIFCALSLPTMAQVRNPWHLRALMQAVTNRDGQLLPHSPCCDFETDGERVLAVRTESERLEADQFLIATGSWTTPLLSKIGLRVPIRPIRGQILLLNTGERLFSRVIEAGRRYLVPRDDGRVLVGATEEDVGFEKGNTSDAIESLRAFANSIVPELARAKFEKTWSGLRPQSERGAPWIGPAPTFSNLYLAAGHFRSGLALSAGTAVLLRELMNGETPTIDPSEFAWRE